MTKRQCKGHLRTSTVNMDVMKRNSYKYNGKWEKKIISLAKDFCVDDTMVTIIINETKKLYVGREREELMYNHAHKKLMELMWS